MAVLRDLAGFMTLALTANSDPLKPNGLVLVERRRFSRSAMAWTSPCGKSALAGARFVSPRRKFPANVQYSAENGE